MLELKKGTTSPCLIENRCIGKVAGDLSTQSLSILPSANSVDTLVEDQIRKSSGQKSF